MTKFKVGDRAVHYSCIGSRVQRRPGIVEAVESQIISFRPDSAEWDHAYNVAAQNLRRLVKKERRRVWIWRTERQGFINFIESPPGPKQPGDGEWIEFIEVKK